MWKLVGKKKKNYKNIIDKCKNQPNFYRYVSNKF